MWNTGSSLNLSFALSLLWAPYFKHLPQKQYPWQDFFTLQTHHSSASAFKLTSPNEEIWWNISTSCPTAKPMYNWTKRRTLLPVHYYKYFAPPLSSHLGFFGLGRYGRNAGDSSGLYLVTLIINEDIKEIMAV